MAGGEWEGGRWWKYIRKKRATTAKSKMRYINYSARDDEQPLLHSFPAQPVRLYNNQAKTYFCDFNKNFTTLFRAPAKEVLYPHPFDPPLFITVELAFLILLYAIYSTTVLPIYIYINTVATEG